MGRCHQIIGSGLAAQLKTALVPRALAAMCESSAYAAASGHGGTAPLIVAVVSATVLVRSAPVTVEQEERGRERGKTISA